MVPDLHERFRRLRDHVEDIDAPNVLGEAFRRSPAIGPDETGLPWRRMGIVVFALALAFGATFQVVRVFDQRQPAASDVHVLPYPLAYTGADGSDPHWTGGELWLMDQSGKRVLLSADPGDGVTPAWSPDGSRIAFDAELDLGDQIWIVNADGTGLRQLTTMVPMQGDAINDSPAWSPDGSQIAFNCFDGRGFHELCVVNADGSHVRKLTSGTNVDHDTAPMWIGPNELMFAGTVSPGSFPCSNGETCWQPGVSGTYVVHVDGDGLTKVGEELSQMTLSPDGHIIAFACPTEFGDAICTVTSQLTDSRQITFPPTDPSGTSGATDTSPAWLPDGRLSFLRSSWSQTDFDGYDVYVVDPAGGTPTELANLGDDVRGMSWGPAPEAVVSPTPSAPETSSMSPSPDVQQGKIPDLALLWSAEIADPAMPADVVVDGDVIYVPTRTGVVAYPIDCSGRCAPLWRGSVGTNISGPSVSAGQGVVAIVDPTRGLFVFDAGCATDGSECQPRWSAAPDVGEHLSSPSIDQGTVRVTGGTGEAPAQRVRVLAFPLDCAGNCMPAWTADEGTGTIYGEVTELDGVGYQQVGMTMYGFPSDCRADGGTCAPDLQIQATGSPNDQTSSLYGPVGDAEDIVFTAGDGNAYSYAPHCGVACTPRWVGAASDYLESRPVLQGEVVYVATSSGILGFPLHCQARCAPQMRADLGGYVSIEVADADGLVAASHLGPSQGVFVISTGCGDPCTPTWRTDPGGDIYGVGADASSVVLGASPDSILAYPRDCTDGCTSSEPISVAGEAWWLFEVNGRLIVGARDAGVASDTVTLSVFQIT